ncbi:hypothetical protein Tco_0889804 [Tanacetum coccineum]
MMTTKVPKKPRESGASATKQHPTLSSTGWQITDTRDVGADYSMHISDPESGHSEQSSDDIPIKDEGNDSDMEDTDNAHIPKVSTTTWFKPIPESERPATPEPEWTIPPNDFPEPENNWANTYATTYKKKLCKADLEGPAFNLVKAFHKNSVFLQYQMDECHKLLTNKVDLSNPEGHQILRNILIYEPCHLGGPSGQVKTNKPNSFHKDLEYLLDSAVYGITHWWFRRKEFYINKHSESFDREAVKSQMRILSVISVKKKDFRNIHPMIFEDLFVTQYSRKASTSAQDRQDQSSHSGQHDMDKKTGDPERMGDLQAGLKFIKKDHLERPNWDAADYYSKKNTRLSISQCAVVYSNDSAITEGSTRGQSLVCIEVLRIRLKMEMELEIQVSEMSCKITECQDTTYSCYDVMKRPLKVSKASANSDVMYSFTSAQDGDPLQNDVRLFLGDDLKKAQDHSQRQSQDESKDYYPKCTRDQMSTS